GEGGGGGGGPGGFGGGGPFPFLMGWAAPVSGAAPACGSMRSERSVVTVLVPLPGAQARSGGGRFVCFCHGQRPSISTSREKLRNVLMITITPSIANAGERRLSGHRPDNIARHQKLQAQQDNLPELLAERTINIGLTPDQPHRGEYESIGGADNDDDDSHAVNHHPGLLDHAVEVHLTPVAPARPGHVPSRW